MNKDIINRFDAKRQHLFDVFKGKHPANYSEIVHELVKAITSDDEYGECNLDPERITEIDHGDYQGSLLFIIAAKGYQPSDYWATECSYGSCSGCDTLQAISGYTDDPPTDDQANDYLTLALHLAQRMEKLFQPPNVKDHRAGKLQPTNTNDVNPAPVHRLVGQIQIIVLCIFL